MKTLVLILCAAAAFASGQAAAQEKLRVAIPQRGLWDTGIPELGRRGGIFKKHGLDLEILFTSGGAENQQAVVAGSIDIGVGGGIAGALGTFDKGAPLRIIGAEINGASDTLWYVRADSPIKTIADLNGKTIAYSLTGTSSHAAGLELLRQYKLDAKLVSTGAMPATFTQVMSGQIDMGYATAPFTMDAILDGRVRLVARGSDVDVFKSRTTRVNIASLDMVEKRKDTVARFMDAYRETIDWMYASPEALKEYADYSGLPVNVVQKIPEYLPKEVLNPDRIIDLDVIMADSVKQRFIAKPFTPAQIADLIRIPPRR